MLLEFGHPFEINGHLVTVEVPDQIHIDEKTCLVFNLSHKVRPVLDTPVLFEGSNVARLGPQRNNLLHNPDPLQVEH